MERSRGRIGWDEGARMGEGGGLCADCVCRTSMLHIRSGACYCEGVLEPEILRYAEYSSAQDDLWARAEL